MLDHEIIANGKCSVCGKPLQGNRIFVCEECENQDKKKFIELMKGSKLQVFPYYEPKIEVIQNEQDER